MQTNSREGIGDEHPHCHDILSLSFISIIVTLLIDTFIIKFGRDFLEFIPLLARVIIFLCLLIVSLKLGLSSHNKLFPDKNNSSKFLSDDVFSFVRHPMYLSILLIYLAFIILAISLLSFVIWIIIFVLYDRMAIYEEKELERILGKEYLSYKEKVGRWIPRLSFFKKK